MSNTEQLQQIAQEVKTCKGCALHAERTLSVPGEGPDNPEIMLIGEGPGANEDAQGRPFVGNSGKFLSELLAQAGLQRSEVWIGNVVKCRPPANRDPLPEELLACSAFLDRQIAVINPKIIITLGRFSMSKFMPGVKISQVHGQMRRIHIAGQPDRFVIAMFHPAAALHQPALKSTILADFAKLPQLLQTARQAIAEAEKAQAAAKPAHTPAPVEPPKSQKAEQIRLF